MKAIITVFGFIAIAAIAAGSVQAQAPERPWIVEGLVGAGVPTFDITDLADPGFTFGGAAGYRISEKILGMVEFDYGMHGGADGGPDVKVMHYMAKAGYLVFQSGDEKWRIFANLGAGAMTFDVDAADAETKTYFGINAGAKVYYSINDMINIVLSPQGDIAFTSKDDGFTGSTAWVWPITAGVALTF